MSFFAKSTTLRVVKPLPGPNWPDQPLELLRLISTDLKRFSRCWTQDFAHLPTVYGPQIFPLESVWLAGDPLTLNVQGVAGAVWVSMLNVQVQVPEAQTRFIFSIVHCGIASAIILTVPDWRTMRSSTGSAFGTGVPRAMLERRVVTMALESFILIVFDLLRWRLVDRNVCYENDGARLSSQQPSCIYTPH